MYSRDMAGTVKWVWERAPVERRDDVIRNWVAAAWARQDRESAAAWLRGEGYDPEEWLRNDEETEDEK